MPNPNKLSRPSPDPVTAHEATVAVSLPTSESSATAAAPAAAPAAATAATAAASAAAKTLPERLCVIKDTQVIIKPPNAVSPTNPWGKKLRVGQIVRGKEMVSLCMEQCADAVEAI